RLFLSALLLATLPAMAIARPIEVKPAGGEGQQVVMCPKCGTPIACAKAGDYSLAFTVDRQNPEPLNWVRLTVRGTDKMGTPFDNARVSFAAWMTGHLHELALPLEAQSRGKGLYTTSTTGRLAMRGTWFVEVRMNTPSGDTVKQLFTFTW